MDNEQLMDTWCRMWSEDPALAHEVMTDTCTQWSGQTTALDGVVGPSQQEAFVTAYRAQHVNVFHPRALADAGDRFAYLWDVTRPDGSVGTGLDLNVVRGGLIEENWTFVTPQRLPGPDPEPANTAQPTEVLEDVAARWVQVLDGRIELVPELVSDDFRLLTGGDTATGAGPRGPGVLTGRGDLRRDRRAPVVTVHRDPVIDSRRGRVALLRTTTSGLGGAPVRGVDLLAVDAGRVTHAWSLPATPAVTS